MPMGERFWLPGSVFSQMVDLAMARFPLETGGMLLGYEAENGEAVVTAIIGPGPKARHRRFRFAPDADYQQAELDAHFWRTDGRETYLGDWHTHPRGTPSLSFLDKRTLARIARTPSSGTVNPIMAILAGEKEIWNIGVVRLLRCKRRFFINDYQLAVLSPSVYTT